MFAVGWQHCRRGGMGVIWLRPSILLRYNPDLPGHENRILANHGRGPETSGADDVFANSGEPSVLSVEYKRSLCLPNVVLGQ
jgi:hypothetical protein